MQGLDDIRCRGLFSIKFNAADSDACGYCISISYQMWSYSNNVGHLPEVGNFFPELR